MKNYNYQQKIMLSGRTYQFDDRGEGETCVLLVHQHNQATIPISTLITQLEDDYRFMVLDITEHFPADVTQFCESQMTNLLEDLDLLCDIYWLDKVNVRSSYQPDIIQERFKGKLSERYEENSPLPLSISA